MSPLCAICVSGDIDTTCGAADSVTALDSGWMPITRHFRGAPVGYNRCQNASAGAGRCCTVTDALNPRKLTVNAVGDALMTDALATAPGLMDMTVWITAPYLLHTANAG